MTKFYENFQFFLVPENKMNNAKLLKEWSYWNGHAIKDKGARVKKRVSGYESRKNQLTTDEITLI